MSSPTTEQLEKFLSTVQPFICKLQQDGYNIGVDSHCTVQHLLLELAAQGALTGDFGRLRTLIAPVLCCSETEQEGFSRYFDDWMQILQPQPEAVSPIVEKLVAAKQEQKKSKKDFFVLAFLVVVAFAVMPYRSYLGEVIGQYMFEKAKPDIKIEFAQPPPDVQTQAPAISPETPPLEFTDLNKAKYTLWVVLAVLVLTLTWYLSRYLQIQRFLKRHCALHPPKMNHFFVENQEQQLYSPIAFARTAQQLHKHRDLDTQLLDVEATVKHTIQQCGFYTPVYKAIKALPEYLVLIDRSSFNDQFSQCVESLLKQLDDFGLFIERYYFDSDPRRCYPQRNPTTLCTLESLQGLYPMHRLMIFADGRHFLDPITNKLYGWSAAFHQWQSPFLFTLEAFKQWDYCQQKLHEAGFVLLATGKVGLEALADYVSADRETLQQQHSGMVDLYPSLLRQRPHRFLERHAPTDDITVRLLTQLDNYLGRDGFVWLAACAVYPELHWQLTLYMGKREGQKQLDEILLLRLARLPWLRHGYMPDWLRTTLLLELNKIDQVEEGLIRVRLEALLSTVMMQGNGDDLCLAITKKLPLSNFMRRALLVWWKRTGSDSPFQDYVFQSFMAGKLAVKIPKRLPIPVTTKTVSEDITKHRAIDLNANNGTKAVSNLPLLSTFVDEDITLIKGGAITSNLDIQLKIGDVIKDTYELVAVLGEGGMGIVFKALNRILVGVKARDPYVAIKVLKPEFSENEQLVIYLHRDFERTQLLANCPNIIKVFGFDRDGPHVYMTMEYLKGKTLGEYLDRKPMNLVEAWPIIEGIGKALAFAHKNNIVHRDIKPGNIIITDNGSVKVLDFGIASKINENKGDETKFGGHELEALTAAYASPEMQKDYPPDARDDIYAYACVIYEILTAKQFYKQKTNKAAPIHGLDVRRMEVLNKALAFERDQRTASIDELLDKLSPIKAPWIKYVTIGSSLAIVIGLTLWKLALMPAESPQVIPPPVISSLSPQERVVGLVNDSIKPSDPFVIPAEPRVDVIPVSYSATSDDGIVHIETRKPEYKNGEAFELSFTLNQPRYVHIIDRDAVLGVISILWPNPRQVDKLLPTNQEHVFPPKGFTVPVTGPTGNSTVTIVASELPFPKGFELLNVDGSISQQVQNGPYSFVQVRYILHQ